jgi:UDP-glucose 4-epimerase
MAIGRVKESTLQVFGNDYPTPCVLHFLGAPLFFASASEYQIDSCFRFYLRDGTCVRDYLHVLDLASGHLLALDALAPGSTAFDNCPTPARFKAYNLGRGQGFSVLQILEAMRKATGFDYRYNIIGRRYVGFTLFLIKWPSSLTTTTYQARRRSRFDGGSYTCREGARIPCEEGPHDNVP